MYQLWSLLQNAILEETISECSFCLGGDTEGSIHQEKTVASSLLAVAVRLSA